MARSMATSKRASATLIRPRRSSSRKMQGEESHHRSNLLDLYRAKFGDHIPHIRRQDVKGFVERRPVWLVRPFGLHVGPQKAGIMEFETRRFFERASPPIDDRFIPQPLG